MLPRPLRCAVQGRGWVQNIGGAVATCRVAMLQALHLAAKAAEGATQRHNAMQCCTASTTLQLPSAGRAWRRSTMLQALCRADLSAKRAPCTAQCAKQRCPCTSGVHIIWHCSKQHGWCQQRYAVHSCTALGSGAQRSAVLPRHESQTELRFALGPCSVDKLCSCCPGSQRDATFHGALQG